MGHRPQPEHGHTLPGLHHPTFRSSKEQGVRGSCQSPWWLCLSHRQLSEAGAGALLTAVALLSALRAGTFLLFSFELKMYHGWNQSQGHEFLPSCWILLGWLQSRRPDSQTAEDSGVTPLLGICSFLWLPCQSRQLRLCTNTCVFFPFTLYPI